jgi:hypothetical protein
LITPYAPAAFLRHIAPDTRPTLPMPARLLASILLRITSCIFSWPYADAATATDCHIDTLMPQQRHYAPLIRQLISFADAIDIDISHYFHLR